MHDQNMTYVSMPLISQCRWPPSPDKSLTETMRNILPRGQPPGRASPARVEIAPQFLGGDFHRLLGEYLSPATPWCRAAFFVTECLEIGRHHDVAGVDTMVSCHPCSRGRVEGFFLCALRRAWLDPYTRPYTPRAPLSSIYDVFSFDTALKISCAPHPETSGGHTFRVRSKR